MISATSQAEIRRTRTRWTSRLSAGAVAALVGGFFLYCTWPGLFVGFDNDDVMNLHFAWSPPLSKFLLGNLVPFTTFYRPSGAAYYRLCYALFGWRPGAFRGVTYALMLVNLFLVYLLGRKLTRSAEAGVISALLYTFHGHLRQMYMSNGTCYDVLCTSFTLLTLWYYVRVRQAGSRWRWPQVAAVVALFVAALNAKEMAAVLPGLFLLYEWIYHPPSRLRETARWIWRNGRIPAFTLLLALLAFWGKRQPGSVLYAQQLYTPSFTIRRFFQNERGLLSELLYQSSFNTSEVVLFYGALFAVAAITRKKPLWFFAWFALLTPLPIIFIPYRGFFVMYLPMAGIALYLGSALVEGRDWLWRVLWNRPPLPPNAWEPERIVLFACIAILLPLGRNIDPQTMLAVTDRAVQYVQDTHADVMRLNEPLPRGARILLLRCRYPDDSWGPFMMIQLMYHDRTIWVDRPAMMKTAPDAAAIASYDRVIDFNGHDLYIVRRGPNAAPGAPSRKIEHPG